LNLHVHIPKLLTAGIKLVGRYLSHTPKKNLTRAEALALGNKDIGCWMVWETTKGRALAGADAGRQDAVDAVAQAQAIGAPKGAGIYFAVDMDATDEQIHGPVNNYFAAVKAAIDADYIPGVYGNGPVCAWCLDHGLTQLAWVWAGRLTNGTQAFVTSNRWHLHQHPEVAPDAAENPFGFDFDPDDFKPACGAFLIKDSGPTVFGA
jgi:hypothetical protein